MNAHVAANFIPRFCLLVLYGILCSMTGLTSNAQDYQWTNATGDFDWNNPANWGIDDGTVPSSGADVDINSAGGPVQYNSTSVPLLNTLDVGPGAALHIETGSIGFAPRLAGMPLSFQNSGITNIFSTASLQLSGTSHNFSPATIGLFDGGELSVIQGDALISTSNANTGNGTITLQSAGTQSRIVGSTSNLLTLRRQTIQGHGLIGNDTIGFDFGSSTIVEANLSGLQLTIDSGETRDLLNSGILRSSGGGILEINDSQITGGGSIWALAGSVTQVADSEVTNNTMVNSGGTFVISDSTLTSTTMSGTFSLEGAVGIVGTISNSTGVLDVQDGATVTIDNGALISGGIVRNLGTGSVRSTGNGAIANLKVEGSIIAPNARSLGLVGTIENVGEIGTLTNFNRTQILIDNTVSLTGGGTVRLDGASTTSYITDPNGTDGVLTNVDNSIVGKGDVGEGKIQILNQAGGTIDANNSSGSLTLNPQPTAPMINRGLFTASGGGDLRFGAGEFDNAGGLIAAQDDSTVTLLNGSNITGGILQNLGTGQFNMSTTGSITDLTLEGSFRVANGTHLNLVGTINNLGELSVVTNFNRTQLLIDDEVSLTGGGTIRLSGASSTTSYISDPIGTDGVLTNVDNTIAGKGDVGDGKVQLINEANGVIDGDNSTGTLTLNGSPAAASINRGLITASDGGTVAFNSGSFDNSAGLVEPQDGSTVVVGGTSIVTGGQFNAANGSTIQLNGSGSIVDATLQSAGSGEYRVTSGNASLVDVTNQGPITVNNAASLSLIGMIENSGEIGTLTNFNRTQILIDNTVSLTGGGTVRLDGASTTSYITDPNGTDGVLTNVDNSIVGKGDVGEGKIQILNQAGGTIDANNSSGSLTLNPQPTAPMINRGLFTASGGGDLRFGAGEFDNAGGLITAQDDSTVTLLTGSNITGGTLQNLGTGQFNMSSTGSITDVTLDGSFRVANATNLNLVGTINNLGELSVVTNFNRTQLLIEDEVSLTGGGTVRLAGTSGTTSYISDANGTDGVLTNVDNTIAGKGNVGEGKVQLINEMNGVIDGDNSTGTLALNGSPAAASINRGLVTASDGGTVAFNSGSFDNSAGLVEPQDGSTAVVGGTSVVTGGQFNAANGSTIQLNGSGSIVDATLQSAGSGEYRVTSGIASLEDVTNQSTVTVNNAASLSLVGTIENAGEIGTLTNFNRTQILIDEAVSLTGGGTVRLDGVSGTTSYITDANGTDGVLTNVDNTITGKGNVGEGKIRIINQEGGTIHADVSTTLSVNTVDQILNNAGTLMASNGGLLDVSGTVNNDGVIDVRTGSTIAIDSIVSSSSGRISGDGQLNSSNPISSAGAIAPGNSPGTLTINQSVTMGSTSSLEIELATDAFDVLAIANDLTLDGQLGVTLLDGFLPSSGATFNIVTANTIDGWFSNVADGGTIVTLDGAGKFTVSKTAGMVQLTSFEELPDCDFNDNGVCDGFDIDQLVANIAAGSNPVPFDMNGDGSVDDGDLTEWLVEAGAANLPSMNPYLRGDANLDGAVDGDDFDAWSAFKFTNTAAWTAGDFDADGLVGGRDFLIWNANKGLSSAVSQVPEPSSGLLAAIFGAAWLLAGRRRAA